MSQIASSNSSTHTPQYTAESAPMSSWCFMRLGPILLGFTGTSSHLPVWQSISTHNNIQEKHKISPVQTSLLTQPTVLICLLLKRHGRLKVFLRWILALYNVHLYLLVRISSIKSVKLTKTTESNDELCYPQYPQILQNSLDIFIHWFMQEV